MPHDHPIEYLFLTVAVIGLMYSFHNAREASVDRARALKKGIAIRVWLAQGIRTSSIIMTVIHAFVCACAFASIFLAPPPPNYVDVKQSLLLVSAFAAVEAALTGLAIWSHAFRQKLGRPMPGLPAL
jgi:hypothetical protein